MKIRLVSVVWGARFTDIFLRITVRSLLSDGNVGSLSARHDVTFTIETTEDDARTMRSSPFFQQLEALVRIEFSIFDAREIDTTKASSHRKLLHRAAEKARQNGDVLFLVIADMLFSTGTLVRWAEFFERGYNAVWTSVPQTVLETTFEELEKSFPPSDLNPISLSAKEVHRLFIRHMHPLMTCMFRDSRRWIQHPEMVFRELPDGLAMRAIVSHPFCTNLAASITTDAFSPIEQLGTIAFDQSPGVCLEPMLKYVHLHYRPARMDGERISGLGSWLDWFCSPGDVLEGYRHTYQFLWSNKQTDTAARRADAALAFYACQVRITGAIYRVVRQMRSLGCKLSTQITAAAHFGARLRRYWRIKGPITIFVPHDAAIEAFGRAHIDDLQLPGNEKNLVAAIMAHVIPGTLRLRIGDILAPPSGDASEIKTGDGSTLHIVPGENSRASKIALGPIKIDGCTIYVVDFPLCPRHSTDRKPHFVLPIEWSCTPHRLLWPTPPRQIHQHLRKKRPISRRK